MEQLPWFRDVSMEMLAANKINSKRFAAAGWHEGESDVVGERGSSVPTGKRQAVFVWVLPADLKGAGISLRLKT